MADVKENHALINCPHCGGSIRVRAKTLGDKTVSQALEESEQRPIQSLWDVVDNLFATVFGKK